MPQHVFNMLNGLLQNGGNEETKVLGEGIKATLEIVADTQEDIGLALDSINTVQDLLNKHINNKDLHTPKGILVRGQVIAWFVLLMFIVSTIVMYIPDLIGWLKAIP